MAQTIDDTLLASFNYKPELKRALLSAILFLVLVCGQAQWSFAAGPVNEPVIRIGVMAALTGKGAARGHSAQIGLKLAMEELARQEKTVSSKIRLLYQDVPANKASVGVTAFHHLVNIEHVCAIIGPMGSTV